MFPGVCARRHVIAPIATSTIDSSIREPIDFKHETSRDRCESGPRESRRGMSEGDDEQ